MRTVQTKSGKTLSVSVGILGDSSAVHEAKGRRNYFQGLKAESPAEIEEMVAPAKVVCNSARPPQAGHPVTLVYDGKALVLAPGERVIIGNINKLGKLAHGITVIPLPVPA